MEIESEGTSEQSLAMEGPLKLREAQPLSQLNGPEQLGMEKYLTFFFLNLRTIINS